jgi:Transcriptional regulator, AbiEi antitoxin
MDPLRFICEQDGFFTRAMAREVGYDDKSVTRMVRAGVWTRFRRGYYCFTDLWSALDETGHYLVRCRAVLHSLGKDVALSHVSGVLAHKLSVWRADLRHVHVTRLDGAQGRIEGDVIHHEGKWADNEVVEVDGLRVLLPVRCALEYGTRVPSEEALVVLDSLLHTAHADEDDLARQFEKMGAWPGMRHLHVPVRMADGRAESVGESRGRWMFWSTGLPAPDLQVRIHDAAGELRGTCDWGWLSLGLLGEFDGRIKYGRLLKPGQDVGEVVFAEKQREDELREITGCSMIRLIWTDYDRPRVVRDRVLRLMRRAG